MSRMLVVVLKIVAHRAFGLWSGREQNASLAG